MALLSACCFHTGVNQDYFSIKKINSEKGFPGLLGVGDISRSWFGHTGTKSPTGCCALWGSVQGHTWSWGKSGNEWQINMRAPSQTGNFVFLSGSVRSCR